MKQIGFIKLKANIIVKTGLHIGAGNDKVEIGGIDNPIIKNPLTKEPYIPGSSIKGKMRALLEMRVFPEWNEEDRPKITDGEPCHCGTCYICRVFGSASGNKAEEKERAKKRGPTRLIVRDAELTKVYKNNFQNMPEMKPVIEEKTENSINRITAVANPRQMERVVPGTQFYFELIYRIMDTGDGGAEDKKLFKKVVLEGLDMLENDYLGGGGTRGNGQISFLKDKTTGKKYLLEDETGKEYSLEDIK